MRFKIECCIDKSIVLCISQNSVFYKDFFFDFFLNANDVKFTTQERALSLSRLHDFKAVNFTLEMYPEKALSLLL